MLFHFHVQPQLTIQLNKNYAHCENTNEACILKDCVLSFKISRSDWHEFISLLTCLAVAYTSSDLLVKIHIFLIKVQEGRGKGGDSCSVTCLFIGRNLLPFFVIKPGSTHTAVALAQILASTSFLNIYYSFGDKSKPRPQLYTIAVYTPC